MLRSRRFRTVALGGAAACLALCVPAAHAATGTGAVAHDPDVAQLEAAGRAVGQADAGVAALAQAPGTPGAPGVGDPYFPLLGNGGFNVRHYDLTFSYDPGSDQIDATMVVQARATQKLSRLDLDLQQLFVRRVRVDGKRAGFARDGQELQITPSRPTPRRPIASRSRSTTAGSPQTIVGSPIVFGSPYGFLHTEDGAFMGDEPNAASTWMPVSDHPSDKATWTFRVTVPAGQGRDRQRPARLPGHPARQEHVRVERARPDGDLSRHRGHRRLDHQDRHHAPRDPRDRGRRPGAAPDTAERRRLLLRHHGRGDRPVERQVRRVPVRGDRSDRRQRDLPGAAARASRSRPRPSRSTPRSATSRRSPTSWHTSGSATASPWRPGRTSGSTRGSRRSPSTSGTSIAARAAATPASSPTTRDPPTTRSGRSSSPTRSATRCSRAPCTAAGR